jgi:hypothetical protein
MEEEEWTRRKRARDGCALHMIDAAHESLGDTPKIRLFSRGSWGEAPRSLRVFVLSWVDFYLKLINKT